MRIIGITGGIGTGKSTVLHMMEREVGVYIVETDRLAHTLMEPGQKAYEKIVDTFGTQILSEDGTIDRASLGKIVFGDARKLEQLNAIVHPAVKEYIMTDIDTKQKSGEVRFYVIEAALLIEDGYKAICDELWYIYVDREERIRRLIAGRGGERAKYEAVMENQATEDYYMENCDVVIHNEESLEKTANVVKELLSSAR
ncbi:MAG: dephospho-CoA kinase [Lachnospiraceae bacterium]|nr:dephospho-CoA kinase [Lachnospiraceae bacterium]HCJ09145.1 dephospho-CoA kinase [Lachnospiraceae bacterium]